MFVWNLLDLERIKWDGPEALPPGRHTVEFDFKYEGVGDGTLEFNNYSGLGPAPERSRCARRYAARENVFAGTLCFAACGR